MYKLHIISYPDLCCRVLPLTVYHWQQGVFGIVHSALAGIFWTFMLRRFKGNLWYPIVSHAAYDTITLTMIYLGILGK